MTFDQRGGSMERMVKDYLCRIYGVGAQEVADLYRLGCDTVLETQGRLEQALERNDTVEIVDGSHMLKGTLFNMGLGELGELARAMEQAAKVGDISQAKVIFSQLRQLMEFFHQGASAHLST